MTSTQYSLFLVNDFSATVLGKLSRGKRQSSEGFSAARCKDEGSALLQVCDHKRESLSFICLPTPFPLRAVVCIPLAGKWNSCIMMDSFQHWCNSPLHPAANTVVLLSSGSTRVSFLACLHPSVTLLKDLCLHTPPVQAEQLSRSASSQELWYSSASKQFGQVNSYLYSANSWEFSLDNFLLEQVRPSAWIIVLQRPNIPAWATAWRHWREKKKLPQ